MTHTKDVSGLNSKMEEKPTTLSMSLPLKWRIYFVDGRSRRQYVLEVHICTGKRSPFYVDFYTHGT